MATGSGPERPTARLLLLLMLFLPTVASAEDAPDERIVSETVRGRKITFLELSRRHGTVVFELPPEGRDALPAWVAECADRLLGPEGLAETVIAEWVETERRSEEELRARRKSARTPAEKAAAERWRISYLDPAVRREADRHAKRGDGDGELPEKAVRKVRIEIYGDRKLALDLAGMRIEGSYPIVRCVPDRKLIVSERFEGLERQISFTGQELVFHLMNSYLARPVERFQPVHVAFRYYLTLRSLDPDLLCLLARHHVVKPAPAPLTIEEILLARPPQFNGGIYPELLALFLRYLRERDPANLPRLLTALAGNQKGVAADWDPVACRKLVETAVGQELGALGDDFRAWSKRTFERDRDRALEAFHRLFNLIHW